MIRTNDLILKKAEYDDWHDMYINLWRHQESARYMLWRTSNTEAEAKERIRRTIDYQKCHDHVYLVYEQKTGQAIGFAGMEKISEHVYEDTGIAIGPAFVGKGYGKQILEALVKYAFEKLNAEKFVCACRSQNVASRRLQLSCGFRYLHSEDKVDNRNGGKYILEFYELEKVKDK